MLTAPRPLPARREPGRIGAAGAASLGVHLLLLAIIVTARVNAPFSLAPPAPPGFDVVFGPPQETMAAQPEPAQAEEAPQVNLFGGPQYVPPPPPPDAEAAEAPPPPPPPLPRRPAPPRNPFAGLPLYGFSRGHAPPRPVQMARGMDLDTAHAGAQTENPNIVAPGADGSFLAALSDYVERHKYYPDLAVRNGESGTSVIRAVFNRDGTVKSVQLLGSAGSRTLDVAWMDLFKGKRIAPFPPGMTQATQEVTLSMQFELVPQ